jgi:hypothetical protein
MFWFAVPKVAPLLSFQRIVKVNALTTPDTPVPLGRTLTSNVLTNGPGASYRPMLTLDCVEPTIARKIATTSMKARGTAVELGGQGMVVGLEERMRRMASRQGSQEQTSADAAP